MLPARGHEPLPDALLEAVAAKFRALAEPMRLKLLQVLFAQETVQECSVQELADAAGLSQANASKHLSVLAAVGLLRRRKSGVRVLYGPADDTARRLCDLMCDRVRRAAQEAARRVGTGP